MPGPNTSIEELDIMNQHDFKANRIHTQGVIYRAFTRFGLCATTTTFPGVAFDRMAKLLTGITKGVMFNINFVECDPQVFADMQEEFDRLQAASRGHLKPNYKLTFADAIDTDRVPVTRFEDLDTCANLDTVANLFIKRFNIQRHPDTFNVSDYKGFMFSVTETAWSGGQCDRLQFIQNHIMKPLGAEIKADFNPKVNSTATVLGVETELQFNKSEVHGSWGREYRFSLAKTGRVELAILFRFSEGRAKKKGDPGPNAYPIVCFAVLYK